MKTYTLHNVHLFSLFKIGFIIGLVFSCLPVTFLAAIILKTVNALENWMSGLVYNLRLPLIGDLSINVVELLHLQGFYAGVQRWTLFGSLNIVLVVLLVLAALAAAVGLLTVLAGLIFNLLSRITGGIQLDISETAIELKE